MPNVNLSQYSDKRSYNNLPVPEGFYLAPFLVHNWDEVKAMNYHSENLETWHFSGIAVLVAFTPVTAELFPGTHEALLERCSHLHCRPEEGSEHPLLRQDAGKYDVGRR